MTRARALLVEVQWFATPEDVDLSGVLKDVGRNGGFRSSSSVSLRYYYYFFIFECFRFLFSASVTMFIIREGNRAWRLLLHPYGTTAVLMFGSYNNQCIRVTAVA